MDENKQNPIDLLQLLNRFLGMLGKLWILVLVLGVAAGAFFYMRAKNSYTPMYESEAIFTVESGYANEDIFGTGTFFDQYAAEQLAASFPQVLNTDIMRELIVQHIPKGYINGTARAEAVVDSNMMVLTVTSTEPQDAYDYLNAIIRCYPQVAVYMVDYPQLRIVRDPVVPTVPYNSFSPASTVVKGVAIGVVAGLALVFLLALASKTFKTPDELSKVISLPILISLPRVRIKARRNQVISRLKMLEDPNMEESLRGLRVKVKKILADRGGKTVLITSTLPGEGKSTVAVNLAMALVRDGKKVLLLDGDLRKQSVAQMLGQEADGISLMEALQDPTTNLESAIRSYEGIDFISGGSTQQRHYSISGVDMRRVLEQLTQVYDYVILDAPPSEAVSDAVTLARCADCVLYVVKQDYVRREQLLNSLNAMHQKDVRIDGVVFNSVPLGRYGYGYGYGYGYSYGYGYGYSYGYGYGYGYGKKYGYGKYNHEKRSSGRKHRKK